MIPDLIIGGRPVSRAEVAAAPPLPVESYVVLPEVGGTADPHARMEAFADTLIQRGMTPSEARSRAERTAVWTDRRDRV